MKQTRIVGCLVSVVLSCWACDTIIGFSERVESSVHGRKSEICTEDYRICIRPVPMPRKSPYDPSFVIPHDSCMMVIGHLDNRAISDTLVWHSDYGTSLYIIVADNDKWGLYYDSGSFSCTSNLITAEKIYANSLVEAMEDNVNAIFWLRQQGEHQFILNYCKIESGPPYRFKTVYSNYGKPASYSKLHKKTASRKGNTYIEWYQSYFTNHACIINTDNQKRDTLRWERSYMLGCDNWHFFIVGDTIVFDNECSRRPSCSSPFVVRDNHEMETQYSNYRQWMNDKHTRTLNSDGISVVRVQLYDRQSLFSKPFIIIDTLHLPSSPLNGNDITDKYLKENPFLF